MSNRLFSVNNPVTHCERRRVPRTWGATVLTVVTLLALAALTGCLWSVVRQASGQTWRLGDWETGRLLAVAPLPQGMGFGLLLSLSVLGIVIALALAVRKVRENDAFCAGLQEKQMQRRQRALRGRGEFVEHRGGPHEVAEVTVEPATEIRPTTDAVKNDRAPIPPEDLRRIVSAMVVETCEARDLVRKAQRTLSVDDYGEMLVGAQHRLHMVIGCLGGLLERCDAAMKGDAS